MKKSALPLDLPVVAAVSVPKAKLPVFTQTPSQLELQSGSAPTWSPSMGLFCREVPSTAAPPNAVGRDRPHLRNDPNKRDKKEERHDQSQHQQELNSHEYEEL
jgi:hypothetical protein